MNQILSSNQEPKRLVSKGANSRQTNSRQVNSRQAYPSQANLGQANYTSASNLNSIKRANSISNKADLAKVIRVFCIIIIIFGLAFIGQSTYAMITNKKKNKDTIAVSEDRMGKETKITVETNYPIKSFTYQWNDGEPVIINGDGTVKFEAIIQIPNGNNILNMTVKDYYGYDHKLKNKQYIYESTDVNKPVIDIGTMGAKLNISATDDVEMSYITYKWNDNEEVRIDVGEDDDKKKISIDIEVPGGQNKLTIVAVDKEENRETRTENIVGDTKPTFTASLDGTKLTVSASDDEGISKISITVDGVVTDSGDNPINDKEVTATMDLTTGNHIISISVTNINGLTATEQYTAEV